MYYFPNLDEQTRLIMISELESDLKTGLFYEPKSLTSTGMFKYKRFLKECFSTGTLETLQQKLSQSALAEMVGVSRNTISSIETGQFNPTAKLALILCIALDKKFEDLFYFD